MKTLNARQLWRSLPPDWRASLLEERRQARRAAAAFARVCRDGDADLLYNAHLWLNEREDAWRLAMAKIARLPGVTSEIQNAFLNVWIESKMLPLRVGHRPTTAAALRVLMPGGYTGPPLRLYRGAKSHERRRRTYGFSWTVDRAVARSFAEHWSRPVPGPSRKVWFCRLWPRPRRFCWSDSRRIITTKARWWWIRSASVRSRSLND